MTPSRAADPRRGFQAFRATRRIRLARALGAAGDVAVEDGEVVDVAPDGDSVRLAGGRIVSSPSVGVAISLGWLAPA